MLEILIQARKQHQYVKTNVKSKGNAENNASIFFPLKFYFNAENGRRYILAVSETDNVELPLKLYLIRIDKIKNVKILSQKMERISCSSEEVTQKFYNDFEETARLYGE